MSKPNLPPLATPVLFNRPGQPRTTHAALVIGHSEPGAPPTVDLLVFASKDEHQIHGASISRHEYGVPFIAAGQPRPIGRHCYIAETLPTAPPAPPPPPQYVLTPAPASEAPHKSKAPKKAQQPATA